MKLIVAVIRHDRIEATKTALATSGIRGVTFLHVTGRGRQKGRVRVQEPGDSLDRSSCLQQGGLLPLEEIPAAGNGDDGSPFPRDTEYDFGFLPKRMLLIVAYDNEIYRIVQAIVDSNRTGRHGDGRIFICPMISAMRVRTGEHGESALT